MTQLYAGVGRANLTPAIGAWLVGFRGRASECTAIHDDLYATALVLANGDEKVAIVSCDLIAVHPQVVAEVRELVRSTTDIPARNVMICCSHTHSGPPGYAVEGSHAIDRAYAAYLPFRLAGAVRLANDNLRPARLGHGSGEAAIATNRRQVIGEGRTILGANPDGPLDREVGLLRIDSAEGDPLATLLNYACHPVILGPSSLVVSADFVGRTREVVEGATGAPMLFLQGACGDINPLGGVTEDYRGCERLGTVLAGESIRVLAGIEPRLTDVRLMAFNLELDLPVRPLPGQVPATWPDVQDVLDKEFAWAARMGDAGAMIEVQALAIGDIAIVSAAAEPFVATGMAVKAASPFAQTFFAGYTNGCVGYVPTADAYPHRGYEVAEAHIGYRLPAPVAPEAEGMLVRACIDALRQVSAAAEASWRPS